MNIHKNARTTPDGRAEIVGRVMMLRATPRGVATALGVAQRTVATWLARDRAEGREGLADRSWRPHTIPGATPADVVEQVMALRRQRLCGKQIATSLALSAATVRRILSQVRLSRQRDLDPPEPVRRAERQHPGERIHIDIKQPVRFDRVGHRITGDRTKQSNARGSRDGTTWGAG
jgi:leucine-zipper of insertion element IS481